MDDNEGQRDDKQKVNEAARDVKEYKRTNPRKNKQEPEYEKSAAHAISPLAGTFLEGA